MACATAWFDQAIHSQIPEELFSRHCVILGVSPLAFYDGIMFARRRLASPSFVIIVISCVRFRLSLLNPLGAIVFVFPSGRFVSKAIPAKTFCTG